MNKDLEKLEALFEEFDSQFTEELDDTVMFATSGSGTCSGTYWTMGKKLGRD